MRHHIPLTKDKATGAKDHLPETKDHLSITNDHPPEKKEQSAETRDAAGNNEPDTVNKGQLLDIEEPWLETRDKVLGVNDDARKTVEEEQVWELVEQVLELKDQVPEM